MTLKTLAIYLNLKMYACSPAMAPVGGQAVVSTARHYNTSIYIWKGTGHWLIKSLSLERHEPGYFVVIQEFCS